MDAAGVSYVVAFGGGVVSFVSPCVLPVVPAYLSMVTGLDLAESELGARRQLGRIARDTLLFVAGFGAVFVLEGMIATSVGGALTRDKVLLGEVSGGVVIAMSLFIAGSLVLRAPFLYGEARFHPSASRFGPFYAPVAGVAFGFGWTPCIGPVLASVLAVASTDRGVGQGALLLLVYTAGLGVPFLVVGCGLGRITGAMGWMKRRSRAVTIASSVLLAGFGVLLLLDRLPWLTSELEHWMTAAGLGRLVTAG